MKPLMLRKIRSLTMLALISTAFALTLLPVLSLIGTVVYNGVSVVFKNFPGIFFDIPPVPGSSEVGGIGPHLLGTMLLVALAMAIGTPISILAAVFTAEAIKSWERNLGRLTRLLTHMMIEFPTIVVGLAVYGLMTTLAPYIRALIPGFRPFSLLSGVIALIMVSAPYMYAQVEDGLKSIPQHIREAVYSLGAGRVLTSYVLLRYLKSTVYAAISISLARMISETAALFFTAFGSNVYPPLDSNLLFRPVGSLTLAVYTLGLSGYENWVELSWAASFILLMLCLALFALSKVVIRGE
ncbi:MAG: ABC transporter permease subunit [Sulfolobales archaeon]